MALVAPCEADTFKAERGGPRPSEYFGQPDVEPLDPTLQSFSLEENEEEEKMTTR